MTIKVGSDIVYCASIGGSATRHLISLGVTPIEVKGGPDVEELIEELQALDTQGLLSEKELSFANPKTTFESTLCINQLDIRELQLAKAALCAGLYVLLEKAGLSIEEIDALYIAGGFGQYLHLTRAARIGLIPSQLVDKAVTLGNASGTGACLYLRPSAFRAGLDAQVSRAPAFFLWQGKFGK